MRNLLIGFCFLINICANAQDDNTITRDTINLDNAGEVLRQLAEKSSLFVQKSQLDPKKAATYAAVFLGLGQIYNKQYYKLPIVYGGGMFFIHLVKRNNQLYRAFRNALFNEIDTDPTTSSPFPDGIYSAEALRLNTDKTRRDRDFAIIIGLLWYGMTIVDAHVSAHLDEFNVNDELAFKVTPTLISIPTSPYNLGLAITMNLN
ncbi:MAG: DUF5683 domain-containing protein [Bacteroidetes bacterium]|nr:DUF5683 domain-containing protein [Bacteroidota bacterium]MDA1119906.1 DUF5683 domain-containing protein [Bacteroidota bacterium]